MNAETNAVEGSATAEIRLRQLGDHFERALQADVRRERRLQRAHGGGRHRFSSRRARLLGSFAALGVVAIPSVAVAARVFASSPQAVAASMPAGTAFMGNSNPRCVVVTAGTEYHCTIAAPTPYTGPTDMNTKAKPGDASTPEISPGQFKGVVEETVGPDHHVTGGCRATNADGSQWDCYLGENAVQENIIGQQLLGAYQSSPGEG